MNLVSFALRRPVSLLMAIVATVLVGLLAGEDLGHAAARVQQAIRDAGKPPATVQVTVRGQVQSMAEMFGGLSVGLLMAIGVILLYLAQLGSNKRFIRLARGSELIGDAAISLSIKKSADRCRQASIRKAGANISPRTPHSFLAGTRKVRYDILAYQRFRAIKE